MTRPSFLAPAQWRPRRLHDRGVGPAAPVSGARHRGRHLLQRCEEGPEGTPRAGRARMCRGRSPERRQWDPCRASSAPIWFWHRAERVSDAGSSSSLSKVMTTGPLAYGRSWVPVRYCPCGGSLSLNTRRSRYQLGDPCRQVHQRGTGLAGSLPTVPHPTPVRCHRRPCRTRTRNRSGRDRRNPADDVDARRRLRRPEPTARRTDDLRHATEVVDGLLS